MCLQNFRNFHITFKVHDVFLCPIRKMRSILRAQKNVAEKNTTKGVPAPSARPAGVFRSPHCPNRAMCVYRLLGEVIFALSRKICFRNMFPRFIQNIKLDFIIYRNTKNQIPTINKSKYIPMPSG